MHVKCLVYTVSDSWENGYKENIEFFYKQGWVVKTHSIVKGNSTISHHFILEHPGNG